MVRIDEAELRKLALEFCDAIKKGSVEEFLQQNPKAILVLRLSLGLSQKQFINKLNGGISQVSLIKHERGRSCRINLNLLSKLIRIIPKDLHVEVVIENYRRFESMKRGSHMTSERARELHMIWERKTSKKQRQQWGRKGALKTNTSNRLTIQEKNIKSILDKMKLEYKTHFQIKTKKLDMNVDFVLFNKGKPTYFIEATERKHDLAILCQAYAYRARLLKESYPKAKIGIIIKEIPLFSEKILDEFDFVLKSDSLQNLSKLLNSGL